MGPTLDDLLTVYRPLTFIVPACLQVLQVLAECGYTRDRFYIHCDAALSGTMLPFLTGAPTISFTRPISSVSVSGHKFLGCPLPCGVVITRATLVKPPATADGGYSGARDATITCSRSGHTSLFLWYALMQEGHEGLRADAERCVRNAQLLEGMLCSAGVPASLNQFSIMVSGSGEASTHVCPGGHVGAQPALL
jgi:histidine decarboxylase